ncbi:hypothetical protein [Streptomyces lydicus]|uniref:Uncharacterized protein n=1 Tax=Streptomyces lydicus TaxID=47763 RepID=A0A1D7VHC6_9ACTN|nr:hypothetical protein [Streptomyces lydicus]AOP46127.1 hypothetical protein SL103_07645 [Streptomyces lydicus]
MGASGWKYVTPFSIEDYGTLRPLAPQRPALHFGTDRPTPGQFEEALGRDRAAVGLPPGRAERLFDECGMRWTGRYVALYTGDAPTHLGVFGFSGD